MIRLIMRFGYLVSAFAAFGVGQAASVGLNKYDLVQQYLGRGMGGDGNPDTTAAERMLAKKAILDAHSIGVRYFRVAIMGYAPTGYGKPGDLDFWMKDPDKYWSVIDLMVNDLTANGLQLIPTFVWNPVQIPSMTGETVGDLLRNPESKSYQLLSNYVTQFTKRYGRAVLFYELANELNLGADIDSVEFCRQNTPAQACSVRSDYTTSDLVSFTSRLAKLIRRVSPDALISSGYSVPRAAAQHLRQHPAIPPGKGDYTKDTLSDLQVYMHDVCRDIDIVSVHLYEADENQRFGSEDSVALLARLKDVSDRLGKQLFVGEFGDPRIVESSSGSYVDKMLDEIAVLKIPYSAIWLWEFYERSATDPISARHRAKFSLEPGITDRVIGHVMQTNRVLAAAQ